MKIKVLEGATLDEATEKLVQGIDNSDMVFEHIVIVPDRFSLLMEKLLLSHLKSKALFNVSVQGLSGVVLQLLKEAGAGDIELVSMTDNLLLTSKAIRNKQKELCYLKKDNINFCRQVQNVISQFKSSGVKPSDLKNIKGRAGQQKKYQDLGIIYEEYENLLAGRFDANGLLEYFVNVMQNSDVLSNKIFYFAEFDSFTHEGYEVIKTLAKLSKEVDISLARSLSKGNDYIYENDILIKLRALARQLSVPIEVESAKSSLNQNQLAIVNNLFSFDLKAESKSGFLTLLSFGSKKEEISTLCKIIKYKVFKGAKYRDFAVACADLDECIFDCESVFEALEIPFYIDKAETADKTILANFIFKILNVFTLDFSRESLQNLLSDSIFGCPDAQELCKRVQTLNIFGRGRYKKYLAPCEPKFDKLISSLDKAVTFDEVCEVLKDITREYKPSYENVLGKLQKEEFSKELNINAQMEEIVLEALDKIAESYRGEQCSKSEFLKQMKLILSGKEVSSVPTYIDAVLIGDATKSFYWKPKNLIIIGGESLPKLSGDNGLISDDDIESLRAVGKIEPSIRMINRRNRFKLFNLLASAESSLTIGFLECNDEGKKVEIPAYIEGLKNIFGTKIIHAETIKTFAGLDKENDINRLMLLSGSRKEVLIEGNMNGQFSASLAEALKFDLSKLEKEDKKLSIDAHKLFFPKDYTKVTQLECFFACPFKHFIRYGLRLKELEEFDFDSRVIGNICHKLAQIFVEKYKTCLAEVSEKEISVFLKQNLFAVIKEEKLLERLEALPDKGSVLNYITTLARLLLTRIVKEQKSSAFKPLMLETELKDFYLSYGDETLKVVGKVDRVDTAGDYFRILDYKTGVVDPIVKDLYYGNKLQLFLYESGIAKLLNKTPAGALYFDARWDFDKENKKDPILNGIVAGSDDVIAMFDKNIGLQKSEIISISPKAKGGFTGAALAKFPLANFEEYAKRITSRALECIDEGLLLSKPTEGACDKCSFKSICGYKIQEGYRKQTRINQENIMEALRNETTAND